MPYEYDVEGYRSRYWSEEVKPKIPACWKAELCVLIGGRDIKVCEVGRTDYGDRWSVGIPACPEALPVYEF
jgi:hypothetical protein